MRSNVRITRLLLIVAICVAASPMISCSDRHNANKKDYVLTDSSTMTRTKELVDKYNKGKDLFKTNCNSCHWPPEKKADDQYLFDNLFDRLQAPAETYFIKYISDSKKLRESGDQYAIARHQSFNSDYDHYFKNIFSTQDFDNLIIYIKVGARLKNHSR